MFSEAGTAGKPGILIIAPVIGTTKPAPAAISISLTVILNPVGLPRSLALSESDFCVEFLVECTFSRFH